MSFCVVCLFQRKFHPSQQISPGQRNLSPPDLSAELEDSRKFSLASLTALLAILTLSKSNLKALQPVVLTFLMYTITLRLALNTCFLQDHPTLSRVFHVIPLLGITCMACAELVSNVQSPALATVCILSGVFPLVAMIIHHGRQCAEMSTTVLPVRMEHVQASVV